MTTPTCISSVFIVLGAVIAFVVSRRRRTLYEMVPANEGDPAQMPKEQWRDKATFFQRRWSRRVWIFFGVYVLLVLLGVGAWQRGPSLIQALQPTATPTWTPLPTWTPSPTRTPTATYWPTEIVHPSFTPRGAQPTATAAPPQQPQVIVTVVYVYIPQTVIVPVLKTKLVLWPVTVVVTATPTDAPTDTATFTPTYTPTATPTP